jgi:alpha-galactosidase
MADALVSSGMRDAGYIYLNIDDTWEGVRDAAGNLQSNHKFPDMKALADYVHSKGLKLGIYSGPGPRTCAGYPASYGHEEQDAKTWAAWGVDYLKYDWCSAGRVYKNDALQPVYQKMGAALEATGRPIVYSLCEYGLGSVEKWGPAVGGNLWRTTGDINDSWESMIGNVEKQVPTAAYAGPGHWNDPDMLEIGNGMSAAEDQSEFSLWAEMAAPLIEGSNLVSASSATLSILANKAVIAVDQDPLGKQGTEVSSAGGLDVLAKPLANGDVSVALFNETGSAATISTSAAATGKSGSSSYTLTNLWTGATSTTTGAISASVPPHGTVMFRVSGGSTATLTSGEIHAVGAAKCLDVPNGSTTAGTQTDIWTCNGGSNQIWTQTSGGQLTVYTGSSQLCLDAYNNQTTAGTKVETWPCTGGANQQWNLNANGTITGVQSGLCLDVTGASTANGALAELWTCNGQSNQQWTFG